MKNRSGSAWLLALVLALSALALPTPAKADVATAAGVDMSYLVRDERGMWSDEWTNDAAAVAPASGITGVRIRLAAEDADDYDVWYRARQVDGTWLDWRHDGLQLISPDFGELVSLQIAVSDEGCGAPLVGDDETVLSATDESEAPAAPIAAQSATWTRLAGSTRYDTMSAIVSAGFTQSESVVVASGESFPDALSATSLAGALDCPLVLTSSSELSAQANYQIERLGAKKAYVMGGESAVGPAVVGALEGAGLEVERVSGDDRVLTSLASFNAVRAVTQESNTVIVAAGKSFADALSIGPWAYDSASPILLTRGDGTLADPQVDAVRLDKGIINVLIVGGDMAVHPNVEKQLAGLAIERISGNNRYETSKAIAAWEIARGFGLASPSVASGVSFPDALVGGPFAGARKSVLLIASKASDPTLDYLREHASEVTAGYLLGGEGAMPVDDPLATPPVELDPMEVKATPYASATGWLMMVDCTLNQLWVFQGSQNNWKLYDTWRVSTGAPSTPTVKGVFTVGDRGLAFGDGTYVCEYWTQFYGAYLFHSILYWPDGTQRDGRLGLNISHGCVRMDIRKAKWIYDTIPYATTVVVY